MNEWKQKQKVVENKDNGKVMKEHLDYKFEKFVTMRYDHVLQEIRLLQEILESYKRLINDGITYDEQEYKGVLEQLKKLEAEKHSIMQKAHSKGGER